MTETNGQAPEPIQRGRYSLYDGTDGGYVLAWCPDGSEDTQRTVIPGWLVKMAAAQGEGGLMSKLRGAMTGGLSRG